MQTLELLAPARDAATALAAIRHGADAVYIGAPAFGARAAATNSLDDIARVVAEAHPFGVKVYVTLNTIIYKEELDEARRMVESLWQIGVDALIVQDMALLELDIPPIDLHASTQTDARTPEKISRLAKAGFSQIVVPREFSLEEIRLAHQAAPQAKLETFVHGALCVSYSGDCHAGAILSGRSANRGECPQICRLEFTLTDRAGRPVKNLPDGGNATRHWLSLADLNRLDYLQELIDAGASSFKIEGRLKSQAYVKTITLAYSNALDRITASSDGKLRRASFGKVDARFTPDVSRTFNRGFTPYFLKSRFSTGITSWLTPKWVGRPIGEATRIHGNKLRIKATEQINNGDGLGFFTAEGKFAGFRVNRAEGEWIYPAPGSTIPTQAGTQLYRNSDTNLDTLMARDDTARRTIGINLTLRHLPDGRIAIDAEDERGCHITVVSQDIFTDKARTPQEQQRLGILDRLGDTIYRLDRLIDRCGDAFIPSKALTALRRKAIETLDRDWHIRYRRQLRLPSTLTPDILKGYETTYHDNIANPLAEKFYRSHGATVSQLAAEVEPPTGEKRIMTTRYCLRRELGCCLKGERAGRLPQKLYLDAPIGRLRLDFDCENCRMEIFEKGI